MAALDSGYEIPEPNALEDYSGQFKLLKTTSINEKPKKAKGLLEKYKNKELQDLENAAWEKAVEEKYEDR